MKSKIKWGILGLGKIAHSFANDLKLIPEAELAGVASSNFERAETFAKQFNAKAWYGSYEELLTDPEVTVVYIATLHPNHFEWSIKAMQHGKAVLCEKPLGMNRSQVSEMVATAKKHQVFLMEAFWTRFNPVYRKAKQMVADGKIGTLSYINASFSFYAMDREMDSRILAIEKGGGALLDIGVYPIFLAYSLLGIPKKIHATANQLENGADIQTAMIFEYPKAQAILYSGFTNDEQMIAKICGSEGSIHLGPRWHEARTLSYFKNDEEEQIPFQLLGKGYSYEINEVHSCLNNKVIESDLWSHQNSLEMVTIVDEVREQCGINYATDLKK